MASATDKSLESNTRSAIAVVFILPIANGFMHLAPAIGATWAALGRRDVFDIPGLVLLFSIQVLIDVADKYVDLPPAAKKQWSTVTAVFASIFVGVVAYSTHICGVTMLLQLLFVPALVIVHAMPLIPIWSFKDGKFKLVNLKAILGVFKSTFGAFCIGLMDTYPIVQHACASYSYSCGSEISKTRRTQALAYTVLYDFVLETIFDLRDIDEDERNNVRTLPVALGRKPTLLLLAVVGALGDIMVTLYGNRSPVLADCLLRSNLSWALLSYVAMSKPRSDNIAWTLTTLVGLLPAWWAQRQLLDV